MKQTKKNRLEKFLKSKEYEQTLQELKMSKNMNIKEFTMMNFYFCIYTLVFPVLSFLLLYLNWNYGVSCGDACNVHSYTIHYIIQSLFVGMGILNIILYILCKDNLHNKGVCVGGVICNCILNFYNFLLAIEGWFFIIVMIPAAITLPIQFVLLWYIFFKEFLQKEKNVFLMALLFGIITCAFLFLLLMA